MPYREGRVRRGDGKYRKNTPWNALEKLITNPAIYTTQSEIREFILIEKEKSIIPTFSFTLEKSSGL